MASLSFDGRVAVVTGAGSGLGRAHALELARRGARVVVNDIGAATDGAGVSDGPAQRVVDEITAAGGTAVASTDSVATPDGGAAVVRTAVEAFGTVHIVVNNAGILRDASIRKLTPDDLRHRALRAAPQRGRGDAYGARGVITGRRGGPAGGSRSPAPRRPRSRRSPRARAART